jgi:peptide/nickel transport system substrate-binding protein
MKWKCSVLLGLGGLVVAAVACSRLPEPELPTLASTQGPPPAPPTPTPPPAHTDLVVCLANEPPSLYLYADTNREADTILEAIYDGPTDIVSFQVASSLLVKLPSFADGDARLEIASLRAGDVYLNPESNEPAVLASGQPYLPSGCHSPDCVQEYRTGAVQMDRLVVDSTLRPDIVWADGQPLTAADSVFSYQLDGDPATPTTKYLFDRTYSYKALDNQTLEWTGLPGFIDSEYQSNVWSPLPEHQLKEFSAAELLTSESSARLPLGWGPYQIDKWVEGQQIVLTPNEHFWAGSEETPFSRVIFRFLGDQADQAVDELRTGECDFLDETLLGPQDLPALQAAHDSAGVQVSTIPGSLVMRLDFDLDPVDPSAATALFSDPGLRQALGMCINRPALIADDMNGTGDVTDSFLPPAHPLYSPALPKLTYDPAGGRARLDQLGWKTPQDDTTTRMAHGVAGIPDGVPLKLGLLAPAGEPYSSLGASLTSELADCGVQVTVTQLAPAELFAGWPKGPVFGRKFQAVLWSWPAASAPPCEMFASWEIPSDDHPYGSNASGFSNPDYDAACRAMMMQVPDMASYQAAAQQAQSVFQSQLPGLPLLVRPRIVAYASWLCGVAPDPTALSALGDLETLRACPAAGG